MRPRAARAPLLMLMGLLAPIAAAQPAAAAARSASLARGVGPGADKAAALVGHYLREAIGRDERFELQPVGAALGNPERDRARRSFQEAEEAALRAREAYDRLELDAAEAACTQALGRFERFAPYVDDFKKVAETLMLLGERFAPYVDDFKKVAETLMLLGAVHILRGDERAGSRALEQALNVYPSCEPDPRVFNPAMRTTFSQISARLAARPGGTLSVATTPGYAEVFVDGRFAGVSPAALEGVTEGRHYVRLEREGFRPAGKVMEVTASSETADSAQLRPAPRYEELDGLLERVVRDLDEPGDNARRPEVAVARRQLGRLVAADVLFIARVRLDGERVRIGAAQIDGRSGRVQRRAEQVFAYDTRLSTYEHEVAVMLHEHFGAEAAGAQAQASGAEAGRPTRAAAAVDDSATLPHAGGSARCWGGHVSCRALRAALGGTALSLGIVGLGGGTLEYILAANTHKSWRRSVQVAPSQPAQRVRGQNQALAGDVLMGVGAALTLAGSLTLALWDPAPTVQDVTRARHKDAGHRATAPAASGPAAGALTLSLLPQAHGALAQAALTF